MVLGVLDQKYCTQCLIDHKQVYIFYFFHADVLLWQHVVIVMFVQISRNPHPKKPWSNRIPNWGFAWSCYGNIWVPLPFIIMVFHIFFFTYLLAPLGHLVLKFFFFELCFHWHLTDSTSGVGAFCCRETRLIRLGSVLLLAFCEVLWWQGTGCQDTEVQVKSLWKICHVPACEKIKSENLLFKNNSSLFDGVPVSCSAIYLKKKYPQ